LIISTAASINAIDICANVSAHVDLPIELAIENTIDRPCVAAEETILILQNRIAGKGLKSDPDAR
jgi:hypothetical protein